MTNKDGRSDNSSKKTEKAYEQEFKALEVAIKEIESAVPELRVNPVQLKGGAVASWQVEDARKNKLFIVLSGPSKDEPEPDTDLVFTVEAEVGQLLGVEATAAKALLEINYSKLNMVRVGLAPEGRVVVLHRRWFEGLTVRDAFDAIAEVWNGAETLRTELKPAAPGHA